MAELANVTTVGIEPSADSLDQRRLKPQAGKPQPERVKKEPKPVEEMIEADIEDRHKLDVKA